MNIFYGPEQADREKFMMEKINPDNKTIIMVPDQFSLQMEKNALAFFAEKTGRRALLNLMVADFSSLGNKVVKEKGGRQPELIDKYGRHMLLSLIIESLSERDELGIYRKMKGRNSFTEGMNQLISEMKRYGVAAGDIMSAAEKTEGFLKSKLEDIGKIFTAYQDAIEGRFTDTEDYMLFYGSLMEQSQLIKDADVWVYGFDTFTPLNIQILKGIARGCRELNIVMMCDSREQGGPEGLFDLSWVVIENLQSMADEAGIAARIEKIGLAKPVKSPGITLVEASGIYAEAERIAAYAWELVRDRGYRFSDITVICNDMDVRGNILKRTFDRWNIPAFADKKRRVLHQPMVRFLLSFLEIISSGHEGNAVMEMVSSGMMDWEREDEELLANYVKEASVRKYGWKKPFKWQGRDDRGCRYSDEDLVKLNNMRSTLVDMAEAVKDDMGRNNTAREKIQGLYRFLENSFHIREKTGRLIARQEELGLAEGAAETAQSWSMICGLFSQIVRIIGEERISNRQLLEVISAGLEEMEIGLVPSGTDLVLIGTLQRTRVSCTKAMIIMAANEGVLPLQGGESGLLTGRELDVLENMKLNVTKKDSVRRQEEQLAIYRTLALPEEELFVTCSLADQDGKAAVPSGLFTSLKERPGAVLLGDLKKEDASEMMLSSRGSLPHLADAMRGYMENGRIERGWLTAFNWYRENDAPGMRYLEKGLTFDNKMSNLEKDLADSLYFGDRDTINVSASRLEVYSSCPFRHFVERGLGADDPRMFEPDGRSRGDVYHDALQKLSLSLMPEEGMSVTSPDSPWMKITKEKCREEIERIIMEETAAYGEGMYEAEMSGQFQRRRIVDICSDAAWAMINQVRRSSTSHMCFEEPFGFGSSWLKPVEIQLDSGRKAVLQGRIDRIDILDTPDCGGERKQAVRIIDYKTGNVEIKREHIESGYKLQLMVYMNAVKSAGAPRGGEMSPAGVFYFRIADLDLNADASGTPEEKGESVEDRIARACCLEGIMVDEENILKAMDEDLQPQYSSTSIPVRQLKDGTLKKSGNSQLLAEAEFEELCRGTADHVERICREIQAGKIDISPKMEKSKSNAKGDAVTSCTHCRCRSICMFDTAFESCRYEMV